MHEQFGTAFHGAKARLDNLIALGELVGKTATLRHLVIHGYALLNHLEAVFGNLETIRDFTFVGDTVEGFIMASESDRVTGKTLNLGTGTEIKIGAIAQKIIELTGSTATVEIDPERFRPKDSEVFRLISDHSMMTELTGWRPLVSLDEGLSRTIEWISRHLNSYTIGKYMI